MTTRTQQTQLITFAKLMSGLAELYDKKISKALYELYWFTLSKYGVEAIRKAITTHIKNPDTGQFMPKPADLVKYIEGTSKERSLLAWSKVIKAISRFGAYESVVFDDALIHAVINDIGGWSRLCASPQKDLTYLSADFMRRYQAYLINPPDNYPPYLPGIAGFHNFSHPDTPKVLIGDQQQAKQVYKQAVSNLQMNSQALLN